MISLAFHVRVKETILADFFLLYVNDRVKLYGLCS